MLLVKINILIIVLFTVDIDESSDEEILTVPGPSSKHSSIIIDDAHVEESMM